MQPVITEQTDGEYIGPAGSDIGALPAHHSDGAVCSVWELTDEDRAAIAAGARIELGVWMDPIPPVSLILIAPAHEDDAEGFGRWSPELQAWTRAVEE